jgi:hypothetical protein
VLPRRVSIRGSRARAIKSSESPHDANSNITPVTPPAYHPQQRHRQNLK